MIQDFWILLFVCIYFADLGASLVLPLAENYTKNYFCDRALAVLNGSLPLVDGLRGMNVSIGYHVTSPTIYMAVDPTTGDITGGYMYNVQKELELYLGVKFDYKLIKEPASGVSWTKHLVRVLQHVDMYANNAFSDTVDRRSKGIGFMNTITDASIVLVTPTKVLPKQYQAYGFLLPFAPSLWFSILAVILLTGFVNWILHFSFKKGRNEHQEKSITLFRSMYLSFEAFTTLEPLAPKKVPASLLNMGFSFFMLIITSSYTANLASYLISNQPVTFALTDLETAAKMGASICALAGSNALTVLQNNYPNVKVVVVPSALPAVLFQTLLYGLEQSDGKVLECDGGVLQKIDWDQQSVSYTSNPDCVVHLVGSNILTLSGSWPYGVDYGTYCTSFVETVISYGLVSMKLDNSLYDLWTSSLQSVQTNNCPIGNPQGSTTSSNSNNNNQLDIFDMSGVFVIYSVVAALACFSYFVKYVQLHYSDGVIAYLRLRNPDLLYSLLSLKILIPTPVIIDDDDVVFDDNLGNGLQVLDSNTDKVVDVDENDDLSGILSHNFPCSVSSGTSTNSKVQVVTVDDNMVCFEPTQDLQDISVDNSSFNSPFSGKSHDFAEKCTDAQSVLSEHVVLQVKDNDSIHDGLLEHADDLASNNAPTLNSTTDMSMDYENSVDFVDERPASLSPQKVPDLDVSRELEWLLDDE